MENTSIRHAEYGAYPDATRAYMDYVIHTVKPMIDATYRTRPGREDTFVMGSSMGGCISWLLAWHHPDVFAGAGCLSPAFMFGNILPDLIAYEGEPKNLRIYLDNGGGGMDRDRMQPVVDDMLSILDGKGEALGLQVSWKLYPEDEHNEAAWAARVHEPLSYLLGTDP
jgi:predicted alpha/beta superfamily hydrolase